MITETVAVLDNEKKLNDNDVDDMQRLFDRFNIENYRLFDSIGRHVRIGMMMFISGCEQYCSVLSCIAVAAVK